jgi:S-methylmethionine-dependent homocysteine/selenocysteine methylase
VWLLKSPVIRVPASYFYVTTYFERIRQSLFNQFVIKTLSGPASEEIRKTDGRLRCGISMDHLKKTNSNRVSALKMKKLIDMVCQETITTMDEHAT